MGKFRVAKLVRGMKRGENGRECLQGQAVAGDIIEMDERGRRW